MLSPHVYLPYQGIAKTAKHFSDIISNNDMLLSASESFEFIDVLYPISALMIVQHAAYL